MGSRGLFTRGRIPNGSVPKVVRIGLAFTKDLADPIQFGPAIRTRLVSLLKIVTFGSNPKKISCNVNGWDRIQTGMDPKTAEDVHFEVLRILHS